MSNNISEEKQNYSEILAFTYILIKEVSKQKMAEDLEKSLDKPSKKQLLPCGIGLLLAKKDLYAGKPSMIELPIFSSRVKADTKGFLKYIGYLHYQAISTIVVPLGILYASGIIDISFK